MLPILQNNCVRGGCHNGNGTLTPYTGIMSAKSGATNTPYVVKANLAGSYLIQKIDPTKFPGAVGNDMAQQGGLSAAQVQTIENWVEQGAAQ